MTYLLACIFLLFAVAYDCNGERLDAMTCFAVAGTGFVAGEAFARVARK